MNYWLYPGLQSPHQIERQMLSGITPRFIVRTVARTLGILERDVYERRRHGPIVKGRRYSCYILRYFYKSTLTDIGRIFSIDHTSVMYNCRTAHNDIGVYEHERHLLRTILRNISSVYEMEEENVFNEITQRAMLTNKSELNMKQEAG